MSGVSEGGIILPRGGGIPVDPNDPTKGTIVPVLDNRTLTGAVLELQQVVGQIGTVQQISGGAMYQAIGELGALVEHLSVLVLASVPGSDKLTDQQDEAVETLKEYLRQRTEARESEAAAAEQQIDPAFAGPEATPPIPPSNPEADGDGA